MAFPSMQAFPLSPTESLKSFFVGKSLNDVPTPAAVVDRNKAQHNCDLMLQAVTDLKVDFRAHVKTHKTTELTRMQVGAECKDVRLIVSTIIEAEHLVPLLLDYKAKGAKVNVLYGVPLGPSQVDRLARIGEQLGPGSITVMIDHPGQLTEAAKFQSLAGFPVSVFIKADCGTHRAGINPESSAMAELVKAVISLEDQQQVSLTGFYSHAGHSYAGSSPSDAMSMLQHEISTCQSAIQHIKPASRTGKAALTLSVGASPTTLSIQNLNSTDQTSTSAAKALTSLLSQFQPSTSYPHPILQTLELHAGVYPLLDMQQIATHARPVPTPTTSPDPSNPLALTILTQIHSLYPRTTRDNTHPQALIAAGCLALGREPCKSYPGWGVVSPWNLSDSTSNLPTAQTPQIIVSSVSQEHGILSYADANEQTPHALPLAYGQKLRIYPNHACITGAMYGFYLVVDSSGASEEERERVVDVWVRWRGW